MAMDKETMLTLIKRDWNTEVQKDSSLQVKGPTSQGFLIVDGQKLYYSTWGEGSEILVILPGNLGVGEMDMIHLVKNVPQGVLVVTFHVRGCGQSKPPNREYSVDFYERDADDCANIMQQLGYKRYSVLGWCDGGVSAMLLAANYPDNVKKLILLGCRAFISEEDQNRYRNMQDITKFNPFILRDFIKVHGNKETAQTIWSSYLNTFFQLFNRDNNLCQSELTMIKCPTIILHGKHDYLVPAFHAQYLRDHIKGSRLHLISDGRHALQYQFPAKIERLVKTFLMEDAVIPWDEL
ncbi:Valacyclovir hydrolase [Trichoplax sp. H2]|uniref:AB hydrolase-1 domain-containing protein n=1 Tax=Trichoplax adhaerens TaxID=10228 RepID=B3RUR2_TRIAD|nr:hypothetical protein TRIADDRAFT_55381 [Trichoplax adhaerens]EDV25369.1 hypothetical protein TRIADDRAFT_55381 [Trichoplax adhaerens]RDD36208.1 Valacyclovir hydrolase [Trichoplax sp. H2]|eukprot:XP_002111402.1 hypothetical protein TRIADDRAFT_55381 [Trichoplax adhaerens]